MKIERSATGKPVMFELGSNGNGIGKSQIVMDYKGNPLVPISIPKRGTPEYNMYHGVFRVYPKMKVMTLERVGLKGKFQLWEIVSVIGDGEFRLITEFDGNFTSVWKDGNLPHTLEWSPRPLWETLDKAVEALIKRSYTPFNLVYWKKREPRNFTQILVEGKDATFEFAKAMYPNVEGNELNKHRYKCKDFLLGMIYDQPKEELLRKFTEEEFDKYQEVFYRLFDNVELNVVEG